MANDFIKGGGSTVYLTLIEDAEGNELDPVVTIELPFTTEAFNPVGEFINSNAIAGGRSRGYFRDFAPGGLEVSDVLVIKPETVALMLSLQKKILVFCSMLH